MWANQETYWTGRPSYPRNHSHLLVFQGKLDFKCHQALWVFSLGSHQAKKQQYTHLTGSRNPPRPTKSLSSLFNLNELGENSAFISITQSRKTQQSVWTIQLSGLNNFMWSRYNRSWNTNSDRSKVFQFQIYGCQHRSWEHMYKLVSVNQIIYYGILLM